jgi:putative salt-induced outer membrane protein YdiY
MKKFSEYAIEEAIDIKQVNNDSEGRLKNAYYQVADYLYELEEIIDETNEDDLKKSMADLVKRFNAFDKKYGFGKNL